MLLITPRTFFVGGPGGGGGLLGGRGLISGASGRTSVIGIGGRPWLQKVAALTVAISLTIATVDTFKVASEQYATGYMSGTKLRNAVAGGRLIKAVRVISDTFLWLAQVQTLIRLFPRHKEKVIIKWLGSALIVCDTTFSILNSFVFVPSHSRSIDAIPTISYLFQLALTVLYAAWIVYYALTKRRFAFYHYKMRNISLVALLALVAVLVPIVFFVLDISNPNLAGWGDYVRWVGAAAASVVVWEWVERIEALERDDRKDGVLGREIFDGDEMLDITPLGPVERGHRRRPGPQAGATGVIDDARASGRSSSGPIGDQTPGILLRSFRPGRSSRPANVANDEDHADSHIGASGSPTSIFPPAASLPEHPPAIAFVVRRTDASIARSVDAVHTGAPASLSIRISNVTSSSRSVSSSNNVASMSGHAPSARGSLLRETAEAYMPTTPSRSTDGASSSTRSAFSHPDQHPTTIDRPSLRFDLVTSSRDTSASDFSRHSGRDLKARLRDFATNPTEAWRERGRARAVNEVQLPVMVIPAPPRGRTWTPEDLHGSDSPEHATNS